MGNSPLESGVKLNYNEITVELTLFVEVEKYCLIPKKNYLKIYLTSCKISHKISIL